MRTWLMVGSLAAGVLLFVYEWYSNRERQQYENGYSSSPPHYDHGPTIDEDYIEIHENTIPKEVQSRTRKLPGPEEICSICQDQLVQSDIGRKYCILALPKCGHWFHQRCAIRLLEYHPYCPVCRVPIDSSSLRSTPVTIGGDRNNTTSEDDSGPHSSQRKAD